MSPELRYPQTRMPWLIFAFSALSLEMAALWFQYVMGLEPCVMCVYERLAVIGILLAGLLGLAKPRLGALRWTAYLLWAVSAGWGLLRALEHVGMQVDETAALNCSFLPNFPAWFSLHEWLPAVFLPTGYCDDVQWEWLSLTMAQWMVVVFSLYLLVLAGVLVTEIRRRH